MSQHDFIFSNRLHHRLARHLAFWFACWAFFLITFYIPHGVFPAWNTEKFAGNVARIGLQKWLWLRFVNSSLTFLPLMVLAYAVIYWILPRLFFAKKNWIITTVMFLGILIVVLVAEYHIGYSIGSKMMKINPNSPKVSHAGVISNVTRVNLFNFPIIIGFAVLIKMMKRGWLKQQETQQIARQKANAELQLLKAQIHPHFLFNTLNNIYFFTLTASQKAPEILTKLKDILRYILNECSQPLVPLEKELKIIEDYMALEKIRYGDRLKMDITITGDLSNKMIPPLLLIPLVENSFKHGASKMLEQPWVNLNINIREQSLYFILSNSRPNQIIHSPFNSHIGLKNVKKRLQLLYPTNHELNIAESTQGFEVFMKIRLEQMPSIVKKENHEIIENEFA